MPVTTEYQTILQALCDSRTVVLSLLRQLNLNNVDEHQIKTLVRQCALDLVQRKPVTDTALRKNRPKPRKRRG